MLSWTPRDATPRQTETAPETCALLPACRSGISSCWYEGDTCDMHLEKLAAEVTALR